MEIKINDEFLSEVAKFIKKYKVSESVAIQGVLDLRIKETRKKLNFPLGYPGDLEKDVIFSTYRDITNWKELDAGLERAKNQDAFLIDIRSMSGAPDPEHVEEMKKRHELLMKVFSFVKTWLVSKQVEVPSLLMQLEAPK